VDIEEEFLKFDKQHSVFPYNKDYVGLYTQFKASFDKDIHPEVKTKILEIEKDGYYNDHGVDHIKMVINRVSRIVSLLNPSLVLEVDKFFISPYEIFILLMAIQLHDTGHLIGTRSEHARKGKELLAKFDKGGLLNTAEKQLIGNIARAHGGKNDPIGALPASDSLSHQRVRPQFLAALLRLGDELAEDETRASNFLLEIDQIEPTSKIFHLYSRSLNSLDFIGKEINLIFYVMDTYLSEKYPKKTKDGIVYEFLITEIYKRTQKTYLEALYCGRFLPEECRFNRVRVKINLVTSLDQDELTDPIGYELKENGYPSLENPDIYSVCKSLTLHSGQQIDGEYIANLIKEKNRAHEKPV
jgi:hypothetical protein